MAIDVLKDQAATVTFTPATRWASASAEILDPAGKSLATPTATLDTVDTTVGVVTDRTTFALASVADVVVGGSYEVSHEGWKAIVSVANIDSLVVTLATGLPEAPVATDTFKGVSFTVPITSAETGTVAVNYRALIKSGNDELVQLFHVVRHKFADPMTVQRLRRLVTYKWPSARFEETILAEIVSDVNDELRRRLMATGRYPQLFGDSDAFRNVGLLQAKVELVDYGLSEPGADQDDYRRGLLTELRHRLGEVVTSLAAYDADDDGALDDEDPRRFTAVRLSR